MKIFKEVPNIQFMKVRNIGFMCSGTIILIGIVLFFVRGFNMSIEFTGGTNLEVSFKDHTPISEVRDSLSKVGLGKSIIQQIGNKNIFIIKAMLDNKKTNKTESADVVSNVIENALTTAQEKAESQGKLDVNRTSEKEISNFLAAKGVPRQTADEAAAKIIKRRNDNSTGLIHNANELNSIGFNNQVSTILKDNAHLGRFVFLSIESIGPQVGKDIRTRVFWATILSLLGMLVYIAVRFKFIYGISAVLTLFHDTMVVLTFILILQIEFSLPVVAALLTLIGYSLNDSIVIFDRLRDNLNLIKKDNLESVLNLSINQTLSRTVITGGTSMLTVTAMFLLGGEVIHGFSAVLLFGLIVGTYSSIFQSAAYLLVFKNVFMNTQKKK